MDVPESEDHEQFQTAGAVKQTLEDALHMSEPTVTIVSVKELSL